MREGGGGGGGAGGIWETPFKNRMTPPQLTNFFTWPPLRAVIFLDDKVMSNHLGMRQETE